MKISIERIELENDKDIIDYVTKGLSPSKKNFQRLKAGISEGSIKLLDPNKNVIQTSISPEVLEAVYNNKKRNEVIALILGSIAVIIAFSMGVRRGANSARRDFNNVFLETMDLDDTDPSKLMDDLNNRSGRIIVTHF